MCVERKIPVRYAARDYRRRLGCKPGRKAEAAAGPDKADAVAGTPQMRMLNRAQTVSLNRSNRNGNFFTSTALTGLLRLQEGENGFPRLARLLEPEAMSCWLEKHQLGFRYTLRENT